MRTTKITATSSSSPWTVDSVVFLEVSKIRMLCSHNFVYCFFPDETVCTVGKNNQNKVPSLRANRRRSRVELEPPGHSSSTPRNIELEDDSTQLSRSQVAEVCRRIDILRKETHTQTERKAGNPPRPQNICSRVLFCLVPPKRRAICQPQGYPTRNRTRGQKSHKN